MSKKRKTNIWLAVGVIFLIVLLLAWLTYADLLGDTDVAAGLLRLLPDTLA